MNQAQYHQYQQYQQRMPPGPPPPPPQSGRRGIRGMLPGPQQPIQQPRPPQPSLPELQAQTAERYRIDIHRAKGPQERNLPEGLEEIVIGNGVEEYKRLRAMERKLDAIMTRKRLELNDHRQKIQPRTRKFRIWISNTVENQPWQGKVLDANAFDFNSGVDSTYKVTIAGKVIDEDDEGKDNDDEKQKSAEEAVEESTDNTTVPKKVIPPKPKLSDIFKSITIELERPRALQPDGANIIEWKKANSQRPGTTASFDCLQFERKGDENINCTIKLLRDEQPERFAMSPILTDFIGEPEATRETIISCFWTYVRKMGLQRDEDKRAIRLDDTLRAIFGDYEAIQFYRIWDLLAPHLSLIPPIKLPYTIRVDQDFHTSTPKPTVYDIYISPPDPLHAQIQSFLSDPSFTADLKKIAAIDTDLNAIIQAISVSKNRHSFFNSMAKDPVTFLRRWVSSQKRDLEVLLGESRTGSGSGGEWVSEEFRRGGEGSIWGSETAKEAVEILVGRPGRLGK